MCTKSYLIVAMRGRNPDNPSERAKSNGNYRQRFEPNRGGVSNTITSVQKDNLVLEYIAQPKTSAWRQRSEILRPADGVRKGWSDGSNNNCNRKDNLVMEAMIQNNEVVLKKERTSKTRPKGKGWEYVQFEDGRRGWVRLRKLTPRECFRLQGVREEQIDILLNAGISDSQLYKLAGNSICVDCMVGIFRNAFSTEEHDQLTLF